MRTFWKFYSWNLDNARMVNEGNSIHTQQWLWPWQPELWSGITFGLRSGPGHCVFGLDSRLESRFGVLRSNWSPDQSAGRSTCPDVRPGETRSESVSGSDADSDPESNPELDLDSDLDTVVSNGKSGSKQTEYGKQRIKCRLALTGEVLWYTVICLYSFQFNKCGNVYCSKQTATSKHMHMSNLTARYNNSNEMIFDHFRWPSGFDFQHGVSG